MLINSILGKCICSSTNQPDHETDLETPPSKSSTTKEDSCEEYDPHAHGKEEHPTIFWGSVFHLFKYTIGSGILALPFAFKNVGYGVAIFGAILVGLMYLHVLHLLLKVEYELCKKLRTPNLTYAGIVKHSFEQGPSFFRKFTSASTFLVYFHYTFNKSISNALYSITIGGNFKIIVDHYYNVDVNIVSMITALMVIIIPMALIRNLKFLVPMSIVTNIFNMINILIILTVPINYNSSADFKLINDIAKFPYFFTLTLGAFNCTGIILPLKNDLKDPKKFSRFFGVLNIATSAAGLVYCTFGTLGYAKFGNRVQPNVLLNLPPDQAVSLIVLTLYSFALCISIILTLYTSFDIIWNNLLKDTKMKHPIAVEYLLRIVLVIFPYILAVAVPDFKIMIGIAGLNAILMDEIVPIILHFLLLVQNKSKDLSLYFALIRDLVLISICSLVFIATLVQVVQSIIKFYS